LKKKPIIFLAILLINIFIFSLAPIGMAEQDQEEEKYQAGIRSGQIYTWTVTELDKESFENVFGYEPAFDKEDQIRIRITEVTLHSSQQYWELNIEFWDYKMSWQREGLNQTKRINKNPEDYNDDLFIPNPADEFLTELEDTQTEYESEDFTITREFETYTMIREYNPEGVQLTETYLDEDENTIVKVEGNFRRIPFGNFYLGFIMLGLFSIVISVLIRKRYTIIS
jgi:hypothetical protein